MSSLLEHQARKESMLQHLMTLSEEERQEAISWLQAEAEKKSRFKKFQLVRACRSPGISLVGGMHHMPHDHNDPNQHFDSRVLGWSCFGDIEIATNYGDNPHCGESTWRDEMLNPREGDDWALRSSFKPEMHVTFEFEFEGFYESKKGDVYPAILIAPHNEPGDWYVRYRKPNGYCITRVLNEKLMQRE